MQKILFTLIFCLSSSSLFSQIDAPEEYYYKFYNRTKKTHLDYNEIEGSPYLEKEFKAGKVVFNDGKILDSILLRYDWYAKEVEVLKNDEIFSLPRDTKINHIVIDSTKYTPFYLVNSKEGYAIELKSDNTRIFKTQPIQFNQPTKATNGYVEDKPAYFKWIKPYYYIVFKNNSMKKIDIDKKKIVKSFPAEYQSQLSKYIKEEKLSVKKDRDLIKLIDYFDKIHSSE